MGVFWLRTGTGKPIDGFRDAVLCLQLTLPLVVR